MRARARRRARGGCRSTAARPTGSRSPSAPSSSSTRCSRRAGSAAARRTTACCSASATTGAGRGVLPRPRPRADPARAAAASPRRSSRPPSAWPRSASSTSTRSRSSGGATRAPRLVHASSSASTYQGLSGLPENFVYNTGERASAAPARLDVPLAARELVPARRRAALRRVAARPALGALWRARRAALRRAALDAFALLRPGARARPRRFRRSRAAQRLARRRGVAVIGGRRRVRAGLPAHRADDVFTPHELVCQSSTRSRRRSTSSAPTAVRTRLGRSEPLASLRDGVRRSSATRASASATPARPRRARA